MSQPVTTKTETLTKTETETETKTIKAEQQAAAITQPTKDLSQPMSQPMSQSMSQPMSQSMSQPTSQSMSQPTSQSMSQPTSQSMSQPTSQPLSASISEAPPNRQLDANPDARTKPAAAFRHRAIELAILMRGRGAKVNSDNPYCIEWAEKGVTDAQALSALETALERRQQRQDPQPVNAGLLNAIIEDLMRPANAKPNANTYKNRPLTLDERNNEIARKMTEVSQWEQ
jgi:hypothetical protein